MNSNSNESNNVVEIFWKDIQVGDKFEDGSKVIGIHHEYESDVYEVKYKLCKVNKLNKVNKSISLSGDHLLLCDISNIKDKQIVKIIDDNFGKYMIPTLSDRHVYYRDLEEAINSYEKDGWTHEKVINFLSSMYLDVSSISRNGDNDFDYVYGEHISDNEDGKTIDDNKDNCIRPEIVEDLAICWDKSHPKENLYWLPVAFIHMLVHNLNIQNKNKIIKNHKEYLTCNGHNIVDTEFVGTATVFCVETDSHRFEMNDLIHHNSVTLRNIILHCLTHGEDVCIALVDLKVVEFEAYKGMKNIVAVANSVRECVEVLRIMRECMYARNREMAKMGINDIKDQKPTEDTGEVMIFNHKFKDSDVVEIKTKDGEIKQVTVKELEGYLDHDNY